MIWTYLYLSIYSKTQRTIMCNWETWDMYCWKVKNHPPPLWTEVGDWTDVIWLWPVIKWACAMKRVCERSLFICIMTTLSLLFCHFISDDSCSLFVFMKQRSRRYGRESGVYATWWCIWCSVRAWWTGGPWLTQGPQLLKFVSERIMTRDFSSGVSDRQCVILFKSA